jgi:hypothetical protein
MGPSFAIERAIMTNIYLRPALRADGTPKRVPDPTTGAPLPAEGAWKERTQYWTRRINDGDAIAGDPPSPREAKKPAASRQRISPAPSSPPPPASAVAEH